MSDDIVENLKRPSVWLRILFMIGFAVALYVTGFILLILVFAQILFSLFAGADNDNLRRFGAALTEYIRQILLYLTFNSEHRPFPFAPFPLLQMTDAGADTSRADKAAGYSSGQPRQAPPAAASTSTAAAAATPAASAQTAPPEPSLPPDPELAEAQARQADITASPTAAATDTSVVADTPVAAETSGASPPAAQTAPGEPTIAPPVAAEPVNTLHDAPGEPTLPPGADQATTDEKVVDDYSENDRPDKPAGG